MQLMFALTSDEPFPPIIDEPGVWVVWTMLDVEPTPDGGSMLPGGLEIIADRHPTLSELGGVTDFVAPPERVWLFDAEGPCAARLDPAPQVVINEWDTVAAVVLRLHGCDPQRTWAPLAIAGTSSQVTGLRWSVATPRPTQAQPDTALGRLVADEVARVEAEPSPVPGAETYIELSAVETTPLVVELVLGRVAEAPDPCDGYESIRSTIGRLGGGAIDPIPCPRVLDGDCSGYWLQGALARDGAPEIIVMMDTWQSLAVAVDPSAAPHYTSIDPNEIDGFPTTFTYDEDRIERHLSGVQTCDDGL